MSSGVTLSRIPPEFPGASALVLRLHYTADPSLTPDRIAEIRKKYTSPARWNREMEIMADALEGELMYPEYSPEINDCDPFDVSDPARWSIWMACDPHMRTPHGFAWEAWSEENESVVCGELWPDRQYTVREYAEVVRWIESDSDLKPRAFEWSNGHALRIIKRFMDTHGTAANSDEGGDFFEAYRSHGLHFYKALKSQQSLSAARDIIGMRMLPSDALINDTWTKHPLRRVFRTCAELRTEYRNVRYPSGEVERPGQERPRTYRKHIIDCVSEGTLIATRRGSVPIEQVTPKDEVWTRNGWKRVLAAWFVGSRPVLSAQFSNGLTLVATPEHRIWANGAWKDLQNLTEGDIVEVCWNPLDFVAEPTTDAGVEPTSMLLYSSPFIEPFGRPTGDQSQKGASFTTKTVIPSTIASAIWNASRCASILESIGHVIQRLKNSAITVVGNSRLLKIRPISLAGALGDAVQVFATIPKWMTKPESAPSAKSSSAATATVLEPGPVRVSVVRPSGVAKVYDISVEDCHEFFANGVLVHNCCHYIQTARPSFVRPMAPGLYEEFKPIYGNVGY